MLDAGSSGRVAWSLRKLGRGGSRAERVAFLCHGPIADHLLERASRDPSLKVVGVFDALLPATEFLSPLIELGQNGRVDCVVLSLPAAENQRLETAVSGLRALDVELAQCLSLTDSPLEIPLGTALGRMRHVAGLPALLLAQRPIPRRALLAKTSIDCVVATVALILVAPLMLLIAVAIRMDSAGPVIFSQRRHGYGEREFAVHKFRTMRWSSAGGDGQNQTLRKDCRVTRVGNFLRRTSLDELPQLWNVLNRTMSLVGPRPHPIAMRTEGLLGEEIAPEYPARHRVKPGITGLAQINGNRGATSTAEQLRARLADDLRYVENWSFSLDLRIVLLTPLRLIQHRENAF